MKAAIAFLVLVVALPLLAQEKQTTQVLALSSDSYFVPPAWSGAHWSVVSTVATKTTIYWIACDRRWSGSNCGTLTEGTSYKAEINGTEMLISAENIATGKRVTIKFKISDSGPTHFLSVHIAGRKSSSSEYEYTVPGYSVSNCAAAAVGTASATSVGATTTGSASTFGSANCLAVGTSSHTVDYSVSGATLSLLLPDGRVVVVNCDSRPVPGSSQQRSCHEPLTDELQAEFDKDNARLVWTASIDGSTMGVETYKILGVLTKIPVSDKPKQ
jgi:hypothetical protein